MMKPHIKGEKWPLYCIRIGRSVYNWCRSTGLLDSVNPLSLGWYPRGKKHLLYNASNPYYLLSRRSAFVEWDLVSLVSRVA